MQKKFIVQRSQDFQQIIKTNLKISTINYLLFYRRSPYNFNRFGIAVSRKSCSVVVKNRIKRQIRAMLRFINRRQLWNQTGVDVIVMVKKKYLTNNFQTNLSLLLSGLKRICL